jgi:Rhs element Vgr protein
MPDERSLPIPAGNPEFTVKVNGKAVSREHHLLGVYITRTINRISSARLLYRDGIVSESDFPLSNTDTFIPGREIEILAGSLDNQVTLFKGLVIRHSLKIRGHSTSQLAVECRHPAVKLTVGRRNAYYYKQKDSDIIKALLGKAGIVAEIENTAVTHPQLVQYYSTDWDFLVSRAEANGKLVFMDNKKIYIKTPQFNGASVCTLQYGSTIMEMDAEIDSRLQYAAVKGSTWDAARQNVIDKQAADPRLKSPGNLGSQELAAVIKINHLQLQNAAFSEEEAQVWADAQWLKSQMSRVSGQVKCQGIGTVKPGDIVTLSGVGDRFKGNVLVTGVRQDFDTVQGWKTHIQFGSVDKWHAEEYDISAPGASVLLPAVNGLQIGVVISNIDPEGEHRVRVRMPLVDNTADGTLARVAAADAGDERGFFFRPEIGDEVILGFLNDDPCQAIILGMLHSSAKPAPLPGTDENHEKEYVSRSKMKLYFNDEKKLVQVETPGGNKLTLSEEDQSVRLQDQNGNRIEMTGEGILIKSSKNILLKADAEIKLESGTSLSARGGTELKLEGTSGAEISSPAVTKVKGSLVQLN